MKKHVRLLSILLLVFSLLIGITAYAASGSTTVFYWKEYMGEGTTSDINYSLKSAGYTSTRVSKSNTAGVLLAFRNKKVVHVYTHGLDGGGGCNLRRPAVDDALLNGRPALLNGRFFSQL